MIRIPILDRIFATPFFDTSFSSQNKKVRTTEAIRTEKRKLRLLLHKLKIESGYLYHNHFVELAILPNSKNDYGEKRV